VLAAWRGYAEGAQAAAVGTVLSAGGTRGRVLLDTVTGGRRLVDFPQGELLPRIC
jgi:hydrogenase expression/formation protein HypE